MARKGFTQDELVRIGELALYAADGITVDAESIDNIAQLLSIRSKAMTAQAKQATPTTRKPRTKKPDPSAVVTATNATA